MASASVSVEDDETECRVCHELFTEPKLLPCGHLLCRHCLVDWMKTQQEACCPLCRCAIFEEEQRALQSLEDVADGFPTDLAMEELVEAQRLLNKEHDCCVCEDVAATALCLNCGDMLCKACRKVHGKLTVCKDHIVEDLSSLTAEKVVANRQSTCEAHPDKTTELYCPTHGASICLLCASSKHRNCPEVKDLEEKAEEARAKLAELAATLSAKGTELDRAIGQLDQHLQDTEKQMQATIAEIEETCDRLESAVKACRRRLRELALTTCSDARDSVHAGKTCLLQRRGKLTSHQRVMQRVEGMKTLRKVQTMTSVMQTRVAELDCSATLPANAKVVSTVTIIIDPQVVSVIERWLSGLGKVKVVPVETFSVVKEKGPVSFHENHGTNIALSNNNKTAKRTEYSWCDGIVMLRDPMAVNMLYEVRVDKWNNRYEIFTGCSMSVGVVTQSPEDITLPNVARKLTPAVVVRRDGVKDWGTREWRDSRVGQALSSLHEGSRVGVSLDSDHCLHLHVDGQRQGMVARDVPQPCYALFDLWDTTIKQMTLLEPTPLTE